MGCVYKCVNIVNNKIYIGMTTRDLEKRKVQHMAISRTKNEKLLGSFQRAIREYGEDSFIWSKEFISDIPEELFAEESRLILCYQSNDFNLGYNLTHGSPSRAIFQEEALKAFKEKAFNANMDVYEFFLLRALDEITSEQCDFFISQLELHSKIFEWIEGLS